MRVVSDAERRARLVRIHGLHPDHRRRSPEQVAEAMVALHGTEAATVHLAVWARTEGVAVEDVERALYRDRSLVKQLAMRRTLWAFPRDLMPAVWGSAAARVATQQRSQLVRDVVAAGIATDGADWVETATAAVLAHLADGEARTSTRIRQDVAELAGRIRRGTPGKTWGGESPIGPRVLTLLGAEARVVRAENDGHWRLNKPTWTTTAHWLGEVAEPASAAAGYTELVRRWLRSFGPGTEQDIVWWLGATKTAVRAALRTLEVSEVGLEDGGTGYVLPDDPLLWGSEPVLEPSAALLPTLDPTTMGWKERGFYLDPGDVSALFDSNGNAGNTAWWDGRIVGAWAQDEHAVVRVLPRGPLPREAERALRDRAEELTRWLDGVRITNVYASQQMKQAPLP